MLVESRHCGVTYRPPDSALMTHAGTLDADCPIWDHVVQLFVCCEDAEGSSKHCDECDVTPWMAMAAGGELLTKPLMLSSC